MPRHPDLPDPVAETFRQWFATPKTPARVLAALYRANGMIVTHADLADQAMTNYRGVSNAVYRLHRAMDPGACSCVRGVGYRLTRVGLADCAAALEDYERRVA